MFDFLIFAGYIEGQMNVGILPGELSHDALDDGPMDQVVGGGGMVGGRKGGERHHRGEPTPQAIGKVRQDAPKCSIQVWA